MRERLRHHKDKSLEGRQGMWMVTLQVWVRPTQECLPARPSNGHLLLCLQKPGQSRPVFSCQGSSNSEFLHEIFPILFFFFKVTLDGPSNTNLQTASVLRTPQFSTSHLDH